LCPVGQPDKRVDDEVATSTIKTEAPEVKVSGALVFEERGGKSKNR